MRKGEATGIFYPSKAVAVVVVVGGGGGGGGGGGCGGGCGGSGNGPKVFVHEKIGPLGPHSHTSQCGTKAIIPLFILHG